MGATPPDECNTDQPQQPLDPLGEVPRCGASEGVHNRTLLFPAPGNHCCRVTQKHQYFRLQGQSQRPAQYQTGKLHHWKLSAS
jgi:hypothetical protein